MAGAFSASFDGNSDEAAHMMNGVLVRDYLISDWSMTPMAYAKRQYGAYPKIAFGVWPPLFHVTSGFWFLLLEPSRLSGILLMAALWALGVVVAFAMWRRELGNKAAAALAVFLLAAPCLTIQFSLVTADGLLLPLVLAAAWSFGRFLERRRLRDSLAFGVFAALAFLTKYNAALLLFLPVVGIALTRQWALLTDRRLWAAPLVVFLIAGPWYVRELSIVFYAAEMGSAGFPPIGLVSWNNLELLTMFFGPVGGFFFLLGAWITLAQGGRISPMAAAFAGLLVGTWAMHSVVYPIVDVRYLLPAVPAVLFFAYAGVVSTASRMPSWLGRRGALVVLLLCFLSMIAAGAPKRPVSPGWQKLAMSLQRAATTNVVMVSGDGQAEGALVTEVALADANRQSRPSWVVLRGSKMLASSTWMGGEYQLQHETVGEVRASLDKWLVSAIAIDTRSLAEHHQRQLLEALTEAGSGWRERPGQGARVRMFERNVPMHSPVDLDRRAITIPMRHMLQGPIEARVPISEESLAGGVRAWQQR